MSVGGVVTRGWGGAVFGWANCCSWVAVYAYRLVDGDVAPALGVKEGMGEGSGLLSFLLRMVMMLRIITIWATWHVRRRRLRALAGGGDGASTCCWRCRLRVVRCVWAADGNGECGGK